MSNTEPEFKITNHSGFHIIFSNGYTVSVQFGPGNYCENENKKWDAPHVTNSWRSTTAEVAIWAEDGKWCTKEVVRKALKTTNLGDVAGWLTPEDVAKILAHVVRKKPCSSSLH